MPIVRVAQTQDIPPGQMKGVIVQDKQILVANVAGKYYAMDALCSHMSGYLPVGKLQDKLVICPIHGAQFDVTTGKLHKNAPLHIRVATGSGATDLNSYQVIVEGDEIKVKI